MRVNVDAYSQVLNALYKEEPLRYPDKPSQYHPRMESKARRISKEMIKLRNLRPGLELVDYQGYKNWLEAESKRSGKQAGKQAELTKDLIGM